MNSNNKNILEVEAKKEGLVIGCYDKFICSLKGKNVKKLVEAISFGSATDLVIVHNRKPYVVSVDFVDNEVDFTCYTKAEYISRFGEELFLEY